MRLFVDLDTEEVIPAPGVRDPVEQVRVKRALSTRIEIQFTRAGLVVELPNDATGIFGVKESGKYDDDYVAAALAWIKTGSGATTVYTFTLSLINTALDTLFAVDGDPANDVAQIELMAELQWTTGGNALKTPTLTFLVDNDVNRGGETVPEMPAIAYSVFLPGITDLTGGTIGESPITHLDAIPTVGLVSGYIIELLIDDGVGNLQWLPYILETVAAGAGVVEPLDYDGTTNDRRWKGAAALSGAAGGDGAAGQDAGLKYAYNAATSGDPGAGKFLFDNATFLSATSWSVSETDGDAADVAAFLAAQDDSTSTNKCLVVARKQGGSAFFAFYLTAPLTDNGGYDTFAITPIAAAGTIADGDMVRLQFSRTGDTPAGGGAVTTYKETIGDGSTTNFTITHNLGTQDVIVYLRDLTTNNIDTPFDLFDHHNAPNTNQVTFTLSPAPAVDAYKVIVVAVP